MIKFFFYLQRHNEKGCLLFLLKKNIQHSIINKRRIPL